MCSIKAVEKKLQMNNLYINIYVKAVFLIIYITIEVLSNWLI